MTTMKSIGFYDCQRCTTVLLAGVITASLSIRTDRYPCSSQAWVIVLSKQLPAAGHTAVLELSDANTGVRSACTMRSQFET